MLARTALDNGHGPFGAILIGANGKTLYEDHNRVTDDDQTLHAELGIVRWLPVATVAPKALVDGPAPELEEEMRSLYEAGYRR